MSSYPAIIACIGDARRPSGAEVKRVAERIRREAYPGRRVDYRLRRNLIWVALAALGVSKNG